MHEGHWDLVWIEQFTLEDIVEMRGGNGFGTLNTAFQQMFQDTTKETSAICRDRWDS